MVSPRSYRTKNLDSGKLSPKLDWSVNKCIKCRLPAGKYQWSKYKGLCPKCWIKKTAFDSLGLLEPYEYRKDE